MSNERLCNGMESRFVEEQTSIGGGDEIDKGQAGDGCDVIAASD